MASTFTVSRRNRGSKFEAIWLKSKDCNRVVEDNWMPNFLNEDDLNQWSNLENCKIGLVNWSKTSFGAATKHISKLKDMIFQLKKERITEDINNKIKEKKTELDALLDKEEMMWRQRAKSHWMREGDKNTKFFHSRASTRKKMNKLARLKNEAGIWCEDDAALEGIVSDYFRDMFKSRNPSTYDMAEALEAIEPRINDDIIILFINLFTSNSINLKAIVK